MTEEQKTATKCKSFALLTTELNELKTRYNRELKRNTELEERIINQKRVISDLRKEVSKLKRSNATLKEHVKGVKEFIKKFADQNKE